MAVAPSLIFYVNEVGGTKEQYGIIMSAFSFASFCFKPIYGQWVDSSGNKYRIPYSVSFTAAMVGNLIYFAAILLPHQQGTAAAVYGLLVGRFLAGVGAANNTLGYSYTATVLPPDRQTTINVLLSMTRILGMALGPFVNLFLGEIDTTRRDSYYNSDWQQHYHSLESVQLGGIAVGRGAIAGLDRYLALFQ